MWAEMDRNRMSERSKIVAPALAQAIDATVAEIEEAIFSREDWFDVTAQNIKDELLELITRDQLIDDLDKVNVRDQIIEAVLNGAIFGTMIAKINVYTGHEARPVRDTMTFELKAKRGQRVWVSVEAIRPDEFIPDPVGKTIEQMHGMAHRMQRPLHYVLERVAAGIYDRRSLPLLVPTRRLKNSDVDLEDPQSINTVYESEQIDIIEYHGKVPARMLRQVGGETADELEKALKAVGLRPQSGGATGPNFVTGGEMVEAIVTVANNGILLRAMVNPFVMKDRAFVACQFEKVPNRFWGRGVAEKGYNPQKALDAEVRARIDAMAYISAPMVGVDAGRLPRGFKYEVKPGKVWTTNGAPNEVIMPFPALNMNTLTFEQTQEMERMVQMGTGAFDTATALRNQSQSGASSLSSNSMMMGAFVKRAKLSIQNISRNFLSPILKKVQWRYMQFDPLRYPNEVDFRPKPTLGIVAREVEAAQMTQLVGMMPEEYHQAQLVIAKGIVENTSFPNKQEVLKVIEGVLNPSPQQQQAAQQAQQMQQQLGQLQLQELQGKVRKLAAEVKNLEAQAGATAHGAAIKVEQLKNDDERVSLQQQEQSQFTRQNDIAAARLPIDHMKAVAALISANSKKNAPPSRAAAK